MNDIFDLPLEEYFQARLDKVPRWAKKILHIENGDKFTLRLMWEVQYWRTKYERLADAG